MSRVKRGKIKAKRRRKILKLVKGFRQPYSTKKKFAKEAILHAYKYAYIGRKQKKRNFRNLWQVKINAALRQKDLKYSQFIHLLKARNINLNRKILSELAQNYPAIFEKIVAAV
ncbi:MAG: 50S ribosomal protein L20 [Candidatus Parcubacteria bacterium]|nr:MAG: 50S ribosomal protein L20 [Candidatus Parcubacteria bacterium]